MASNITEVRILSVPLENDYQHTYWFPDANTQHAFFFNKVIVNGAHADFSYIKKDSIIRYPEDFDALMAKGANYVMYKNTAYGNKTFYAFITKMEFVNEGRTDIYIETDVIQTYMFDYNVMPSFIIREHCNDDTTGLHTLDEGLDLGDYIVNKMNRTEYCGEYGKDLSIVVASTIDASTLKPCNGGLYDGIYSGVKYYNFEHNKEEVTTTLDKWLENFDEVGRGEAIQCMFLAPKKLAPSTSGAVTLMSNSASTDHYYINGASGDELDYATIFMATDAKLQGYTPRNNKLLCYPYRYLMVSNNMGSAVVYKYERFYLDHFPDNAILTMQPPFVIEGCLTPGCSIRLIPREYNGISYNYEEALNMGKFPILNWTSDVYTNWLVQNSSVFEQRTEMTKIRTASGFLEGISSVVGGMPLKGANEMLQASVNMYDVATSILAEKEKASHIPAASKGNLNCGDVITASGENDFYFYDMTIREENARILDQYFTMYGYKSNEVKIPNTNHREHFWYVKTGGANITGNMPMEDIRKVKMCYDRGITFWRYNSTFRDYDVINDIR